MATIVIPQRFAQRRDTTANWNSKDPVLWSGEVGILMDPGQAVKLKVGDGTKKWSQLDFFASDGKPVQLRAADGFIQWNYVGDTSWINLVSLDSLRGADGDDGDDGADGESAYEIAVDGGFIGTVPEWLASLKGEPGDKGDKGDAGNPGTPYARRIQHVTDTDAGTFECDWSQYDEIRISLTATVVLSFTGAIDGQGCVLKLRQPPAGGCQVGLPGGVVRFNSLIQAYVVTQTGSRADKVGFVFDGEDARYDLVSIIPGI
ncbi:tail assembly protein [Xanthomonas phage Bosa]|uniref:Phage tail fiber protein n=1 Tax=Xanthomonas phage Bosa TaxID=2674976 RepID=A0A679KAS3_9CAUD|nr:tail assembly protein [Xanthomonas phage Bosa]CAA2409866.1 Phage tail fiber protein [Xanthomonas phage Bosa]